MKRFLIGLLCLVAMGCSVKHTWKVDSTGTREITIKLDLTGLGALPLPVPGR